MGVAAQPPLETDPLAPASAAPTVPEPPVSSAPRALLGRVPETSYYRVIACSTGPETRLACERELERFVGQEVSFTSKERAKLGRVVVIETGGGGKARAFEVDRAAGPVAIFPPGALELALTSAELSPKETESLKKKQRAISPKAVYATGWTFGAQVFQADLDGDEKPDRLALGEIKDSGPKGSRFVRSLWVSLSDQPFEHVELLGPSLQMLGSVDLDGNGTHELLLMRNEPPLEPIEYAYTLYRVVPGKPLALPKVGISEGWKVYDQLEDHDHSDE